jgi:hypothetical protein
MAYFQMTWTQTGGGNPFDNGGNTLTQTQTTGAFSSPLKLTEKIIPYPPPAIVFTIPAVNVAPQVVTFTWTPSPIPTPYEKNALVYTYRVYDNDTNTLMTTAQTTTTTGTFTLPSMSIPFTTAQTYITANINYIGHYFYSKITTTGGGGTSDPKESSLSRFYPEIMPAGTVASLSITISAGVVTIVAGMTFLSNPFDIGVTQVNLALQSSTTSGGSYSLTDNYDTQTTFGSNTPGQYTFDYNVTYGVQAGKYYKIYSVQTASDGSKLPSYLSTWNATPFLYNPTMPTPTLIEYSDNQSSYFTSRTVINVISFKLTPGANPPVLASETYFTWTLYTSATQGGTYTATSSTDSFVDSGQATTTYNPNNNITFSPSPPYATWCKLYVVATSANIITSSALISDAFLSPSIISTPIIILFSISSSTEFSASWSITGRPAADGWEYYIYESTTQTGSYNLYDTFALAYTNSTVDTFTTTLNGGNAFTSGYWYKLYVIGTSTGGGVLQSNTGISSAVQAS